MPYADPKKRRANGRARTSRYYQKHKEAVCASKKAQYWSAPEEARSRVSRWAADHREARRQALRLFLRSNPGKKQEYDARRRARKVGAAGRCTSSQLQARVEMFGSKCWVPGCGKTYEAIDHVIALSCGGSNWPANLRPICTYHNSQKKDRGWRQWVIR